MPKVQDADLRSDPVPSLSRGPRLVHQGAGVSLLNVAAGVAAAVWLSAAVLFSADWLDDQQKENVSSVFFLVCPAAVTICCVRRARQASGRVRWAWLLFAGLGALWTIKNWPWLQLHSAGVVHQVLTPSDLAPVLGGAGLLLFPTYRRADDDRARLLLDGLAVGGSVLYVSHLLVLEEVYAHVGSGLTSMVDAASLVVDVLLACLAVLLLSRTPDRPRMDFVFVACGLLLYALSEITSTLLEGRDEFHHGTLLDLGWIGSYLLLGLAALVPPASSTGSRTFCAAGTSRLGAVIAHGSMGLALVVGGYMGSDDWQDIALGAPLFVLFAVRQFVLAADNDALRQGLEAKIAQLERLARHHQGILDAIGEGVYGVDTAGRITFINPAAAQLLGWPADDLLGRDAHATFHHVDPEPQACACHVEEAMRSGEPIRRADERYVRRDGRSFPTEVTAAPQQDAEGVTGAVVVFSDISARRAVERMKEEFVSVVSHELRTPLTSIRGSLGLLAGGALGALPGEANRMVQIALDNSDRLTRLINDILDMERIESGSLPMNFATHECSELVATTITALRPVAEGAGIALVMGPTEGRVHADADRIVQALTNLVGNALKFSARDGRVTVGAELAGSHVTFRVEDEGRGIPTDKLQLVFDRFQQVDSSDAREKGGTGLGLAITKTIVERHGGRIWVESEMRRGSTFLFTLPATGASSVSGIADTASRAVPSVLLCDDDPGILEVLGTLLREHGYASMPVARGQDAVDRAVAEHPDVILLDLRMPGMSGWQAIKELKARDETRDIPIIVMSGLTPITDPELAGQTEGWLTKPVDEEQLDHVLDAALNRHGTRPTVLVVEDDDDLAAVLVALFEQRGLRTVRSATQRDAVRRTRQVRPDVIVLDLFLPEGDGYGVVDELRRDGRLREVPVVVYSAQQLDAAGRERLRLGEMVFLTKGHDSPDELARKVVGVVHRAARQATTVGTSTEGGQ